MSASYMEAANIIKAQIGSRAAMMLGASNFGGHQTKAGEPTLSFKIGRNSKTISHIYVILEASDTYRVQFLRCRKFDRTVVSEAAGVYAENLNSVIEEHTGMRTSL